ncbi:MAG: fumarylacetoacetate hydrolase family protein [Lachnospiraceae bacterium]|nr:fumarylacetoacetate hydrolase family protein [Lachnospiraceae bacterium]
MNDLICRYDKLESLLKDKLKSSNGEKKAENYRLLAPIPNPRQDMVCLGVNYRSHIEETVNGIAFTKKNDTVYFSKRINRCNDPGGIIPLYDFVDSLDYEVELAVILKKDAFQVKEEDAKNYIFGYSIVNDVSARNIQTKHQQWYLGKSLDGYAPFGPCIVTPDEFTDVYNLSISCCVNGELRQNSNTAHMITKVEAAIAELTEGMTLKAGTVIATGTPGGVAMGMKEPLYLKKGDLVTCEIQGIGKLTNTVG